MAGTLYLCATPISNLEDITFRVLRTSKEVDLVTTEDTRHNIKLLDHFDIKTPMTSYHEYSKVDKARYLVGQLEEGVDIALITDADTPGVSDPGEELVRQRYEAGVRATSLLGPAAYATVLTISGLSTRRSRFEASLPSEKGGKEKRAKILEELRQETRTIIVYEAPHHLVRTLEDLYKVLGSRSTTVCRELTKKYRTAYRITFRDVLERYHEEEPKGECVIVIERKPLEELRREQISRWEEMEIQERLAFYTDQGMDRREAIKVVARDRGITRRGMYQQLL